MQDKPLTVDAHAFDFWMACTAIVAVAVLQYFLINHLSLGPRWLAPGLEIALLIPLAIAFRRRRTLSPQDVLDGAVAHPERLLVRRLAIALIAVVTLMNFGALVELVRALLSGKAETGHTLLLDAVNIWVTNVIVFALWFWGLDGGGPAARHAAGKPAFEFLFPQATIDRKGTAPFTPGFVDYLFLSFTNATAFSPTDTLPLSQRAKLLMMAEAMISLLTIAFVAARAVNILA